MKYGASTHAVVFTFFLIHLFFCNSSLGAGMKCTHVLVSQHEGWNQGSMIEALLYLKSIEVEVLTLRSEPEKYFSLMRIFFKNRLPSELLDIEKFSEAFETLSADPNFLHELRRAEHQVFARNSSINPFKVIKMLRLAVAHGIKRSADYSDKKNYESIHRVWLNVVGKPGSGVSLLRMIRKMFTSYSEAMILANLQSSININRRPKAGKPSRESLFQTLNALHKGGFELNEDNFSMGFDKTPLPMLLIFEQSLGWKPSARQFRDIIFEEFPSWAEAVFLSGADPNHQGAFVHVAISADQVLSFIKRLMDRKQSLSIKKLEVKKSEWTAEFRAVVIESFGVPIGGPAILKAAKKYFKSWSRAVSIVQSKSENNGQSNGLLLSNSF